MKTRLFCLIALTGCFVLAAACARREPAAAKTDRWITIQAGGTLGCEVDYPVAVVYVKKHYPRWISADNEYWIHFVERSPFGVDPIDVPAQGKSQQLDVTGLPNYYKYEIWSQPDSATGPHKKCKDAGDDHDTGLNVKP